MRLAKYLAACGLGSRRSCEKLISDGHVFVNEKVVVDVATEVEPNKDVVILNGRVVEKKPLVYYLLNKPIGYTTSRADSHAEHLITDLLPKEPPVWPVGRLDKNTSGLIILTNDGDLTQSLTHPKYMKEKEYLLETNEELSTDNLENIRGGVLLADGFIKPDLFIRMNNRKYKIVLHEGRNRIVRRLIAHFGKKVVLLERVRVASVSLGGLQSGKFRKLSKEEVMELQNNV